MSLTLPVHRVRAVNTAPESENKIHDDHVAAEYGFRGGLVPGVTVYGYLMAPVVEHAPNWIERGMMHVRFSQPFYDGDPVIVRAVRQDDGAIEVVAEREDGSNCAAGTARWRSSEDRPAVFPDRPLPAEGQRRVPSRETVLPGAALGSVIEPLDLTTRPLTAALLQYCNEILVRNFRLGPWIHAGSEISNWSAARHGERVVASGCIHDRFDHKGHEFLVADVTLTGEDGRLIQAVRHTAIYKPKPRA